MYAPILIKIFYTQGNCVTGRRYLIPLYDGKRAISDAIEPHLPTFLPAQRIKYSTTTLWNQKPFMIELSARTRNGINLKSIVEAHVMATRIRGPSGVLLF